MAVIAALNPVIRGWAAYYRGVVSSRLFGSLDHYLWKLTYKWATWRHKNKPKRWIVGRYFGKFNKFRNDHWVFGDRDSGAYLVKFSWTGIERHVPVKGAASPDDPALASYWAERRKKVKPPLDRYTLRLLSRQDGLCPLCGDHLLSADQPPQSPEQWERWWLHVTRRAIAASYLTHHGRPGPADGDQTRLVHASCQRGAPRPPAQETGSSFSLQRPRGLLEPCAATSGTHGSEGAPARQRAGATRLCDTARSEGSNPSLQIRRSGRVVQDRPLRSVRWADIPQLSTQGGCCPAAWQQYWQQSRPNGLDPRPSVFQAGHIPSWDGSWECAALSLIAVVCRWPLLLLSPLLSRWDPGIAADAFRSREGKATVGHCPSVALGGYAPVSSYANRAAGCCWC